MIRRLKSTVMGRLIIVFLCTYVFFMVLMGVVPLLLGVGIGGFIMVTVIFGIIFLLGYFIPRVSNWVEYRKWDARMDHYKDRKEESK